MELNPSRHVPRSHRIHFEGTPASGKIVVRCPSECCFTLLKTSQGWVAVTGNGFGRSILPMITSHANPYVVYLRSVSALWGSFSATDAETLLMSV